jgi:hypothetical protein
MPYRYSQSLSEMVIFQADDLEETNPIFHENETQIYVFRIPWFEPLERKLSGR